VTRLLLVGLLAVTTSLAVTSCSGRTSATEPARSTGPVIAVGLHEFPRSQRVRLPRLAGTTLAGRRVTTDRFVGRVPFAVNVWASWCGPCRAEMPALVAAHGRGLAVLGLDERDDPGRARRFAEERGATYPVLSDPDGRLLAELPMLPRGGIPSTLFVDGRGYVVARVVGAVDERTIRTVTRRWR
jgi:thiol-disulfide isomerase/thioredoxin